MLNRPLECQANPEQALIRRNAANFALTIIHDGIPAFVQRRNARRFALSPAFVVQLALAARA
jgi:hypothetical protein